MTDHSPEFNCNDKIGMDVTGFPQMEKMLDI